MSNTIMNEEEKIELLKSFPQIELSYETSIHNKVYNAASYCIIIPEGQKCFTWFTTFKNQNVCILMEIGDNRQIHSLHIVSCCFKNELSFGTIFYGTVFYSNGVGGRFFSIEDILCYKGKLCAKDSFMKKLTMMENIFKREIRQIAYSPSQIVFGVPIISDSISKIKEMALVLQYKIRYIQFRDMNKNMGNQCFNLLYSEFVMDEPPPSIQIHMKPSFPTGNQSYKNIQKSVSNHLKHSVITPNANACGSKVFTIKPDIQNDIYHLYSDNGEFFDVAYIPDYKTSVFMNTLFRKIKENNNLDSLEESDDEEEFENDQLDKFVYLERFYKMVCTFNTKFKKWVPFQRFNEVKPKLLR